MAQIDTHDDDDNDSKFGIAGSAGFLAMGTIPTGKNMFKYLTLMSLMHHNGITDGENTYESSKSKDDIEQEKDAKAMACIAQGAYKNTGTSLLEMGLKFLQEAAGIETTPQTHHTPIVPIYHDDMVATVAATTPISFARVTDVQRDVATGPATYVPASIFNTRTSFAAAARADAPYASFDMLAARDDELADDIAPDSFTALSRKDRPFDFFAGIPRAEPTPSFFGA
jgi:hypothetical protein